MSSESTKQSRDTAKLLFEELYPHVAQFNVMRKMYEAMTGARPLRFDDHEPTDDIKYLMKQNKYILKEDYESHACKNHYNCDYFSWICNASN